MNSHAECAYVAVVACILCVSRKCLSVAEFFEQALAEDGEQFKLVVEQFHEVAKHCRQKKQENRLALVEERRQQLVEVFKVFDLDKSGVIESSELLELGQMRRKLGQKSGEWNEEKNARLIKKMDANGDGKIQESEFAQFFEEALTQERKEFNSIVNQFESVAESCRSRKEEAREAQKEAEEKAERQAKKAAKKANHDAAPSRFPDKYKSKTGPEVTSNRRNSRY